MILVIGGLDCSGSAGLAIDLKVCQANQLYALPIASVNTVQTVTTAHEWEAVSVKIFRKQLRAVFNDKHLEIKAIKIGLLNHPELIQAFCDEVEESSYQVPIIFDPIIKTSSGLDFLPASQKADYLEGLNRLLLHVSCITPNQDEWQVMRGWMVQGYIEPKSNLYTLVSSVAIANNQIHSKLLNAGDFSYLHTWHQPQISGTFRGTGCALATAITCALAGMDNTQGLQTRLTQAISTAFKQLQGWLNQSVEQPVLKRNQKANATPYLLRIK